ncbi:hypothetical protein GQ43DRAFT_488373 [Delitschia confertaspora ATCC 74209]|uniref:Uncharacterized protein n=1 Tax=Delitschia confertaspora ATCC 74209 TaxID=1513339 RepID=A0A9P4JKN5_9PLEO|nr:hypothetical protein GQ43DRAFT_488373 [Delitschia confertaspora ATCC 74209]
MPSRPTKSSAEVSGIVVALKEVGAAVAARTAEIGASPAVTEAEAGALASASAQYSGLHAVRWPSCCTGDLHLCIGGRGSVTLDTVVVAGVFLRWGGSGGSGMDRGTRRTRVRPLEATHTTTGISSRDGAATLQATTAVALHDAPAASFTVRRKLLSTT